jgi:hypothetical protein
MAAVAAQAAAASLKARPRCQPRAAVLLEMPVVSSQTSTAQARALLILMDTLGS